MFFRRVALRAPSFEERVEGLKQAGFSVAAGSAGGLRVTRGGCAAVIRKSPSGAAEIVRAGILFGDEIGVLVDGGNQKFFVTPGNRKLPALAAQLKQLHAFTEDLREALGLASLYNESLGTVNELHLYDRVKGRE